ncbi:MAG TPA: EAL domain-containing protein [Spirochaetota bacterium]|nr:EAL domain-containing protein [Spirochaetota bacterium]
MIRPEDYIIEDIINSGEITVLFQPLVFIKKKRVAGYRAFCRSNDKDGKIIDADALVMSADRLGLVLQIERLFRKSSLEGFSFFHKSDREILLSVNVSSRAVKSGLVPKNFLSTVKNSGVDPSNIIIELMESDFEDTGMLTRVASTWRESGFMIAMDDFGTGSSNWDRIALVRPDLVKLDSLIIEGISDDFFKQEVSHSLISLAHKAGALVVANGIATYEDALKMMELNADILQGDFFSVPCRPEEIRHDNIGRKIVKLSQTYRERVIAGRLRAAEGRMQNMAFMERIIADILGSGMFLPDDAINNAVTKYRSVECIYILDDKGIQITGTVLNSRIRISGIGRIFHPDSIYSDQSNKDYYLNLVPDIESYVSEPYISAATGNVCVTASKRYVTPEGDRRILCVDISMLKGEPGY